METTGSQANVNLMVEGRGNMPSVSWYWFTFSFYYYGSPALLVEQEVRRP